MTNERILYQTPPIKARPLFHFTVLLLLSSKMRPFILAASLILLASFISANDQIDQILANVKEIDEKGWDDDLHLRDIDETTTTTTTTTPTTTTMTTTTTTTKMTNKQKQNDYA